MGYLKKKNHIELNLFYINHKYAKDIKSKNK